MANPVLDPFARLVEGLLAETYGSKILSITGNAPQGAVTASVTIRWDGTQTGGDTTAAAAYIAAFDWDWVPPSGTLYVFNGDSLTSTLFLPGATGAALLTDLTQQTAIKWAFVTGGGQAVPDNNIDPLHWFKCDENTGVTVGDFGSSAALMVGTMDAGAAWNTSGVPAQSGGGNVSCIRTTASGSLGSTGTTFTNELIETLSGSFTVMGRVRFRSVVAYEQFLLIGTGLTGSATNGLLVQAIGNTSGLGMDLNLSWGGSTVPLSWGHLTEVDTWYHWAIRRNDDKSVDVFINGVLIATCAAGSTPGAGTTNPSSAASTNPYAVICGGITVGFDWDDLQFYDLALTDTAVLNIAGGGYAGAAGNQAPVITKPANFSMTQDTTHTFAGDISGADADAGSAPVKWSITCTHGTFTLSGVSGLTFTPSTGGDGTADAFMEFTGTLTACNTALNNATFTPTTSYTGSATIALVLNDLGNTGSGGAQQDAKTITITVAAGAVFYDTMTDGNGTAYESHTPDVGSALTISQTGKFVISGGKVSQTGAYNPDQVYARKSFPSADCIIEFTVTIPTGQFFFAVDFRCTGATGLTGWHYVIGRDTNTNSTLNNNPQTRNGISVDGATVTHGAATALNTSDVVTIKIALSGTSITTFVDTGSGYVADLSFTSSTHQTSTYHGFEMYYDSGAGYNATATLDNFKVT